MFRCLIKYLYIFFNHDLDKYLHIERLMDYIRLKAPRERRGLLGKPPSRRTMANCKTWPTTRPSGRQPTGRPGGQQEPADCGQLIARQTAACQARPCLEDQAGSGVKEGAHQSHPGGRL